MVKKSALERYGSALLCLKENGKKASQELIDNSFALSMLIDQGLYSNSLGAAFLVDKVISCLPKEIEGEFSSLRDFFKVFAYAFDDSLALCLKYFDTNNLFVLLNQAYVVLKNENPSVAMDEKRYEERMTSPKVQEKLADYELLRNTYVRFFNIVELQLNIEDSRAYQQIIGDAMNAYLIHLVDKAFGINDPSFLKSVFDETFKRLNYYKALTESRKNKVRVLREREDKKDFLLFKANILPADSFSRSVQVKECTLEDLDLKEYAEAQIDESINESLAFILDKVYDATLTGTPEIKRLQYKKEKDSLIRRLEEMEKVE